MRTDIKCNFMRKVHLTPLKPRHTFTDKLNSNYTLQEDTNSILLTYQSLPVMINKHVINSSGGYISVQVKSFIDEKSHVRIYGSNIATKTDVCISLLGDIRVLRRLVDRFTKHPNICRGMPHLDEYGNVCYYVDDHCIDAGAVYAQLDRKLNNGVHTNWWHV